MFLSCSNGLSGVLLDNTLDNSLAVKLIPSFSASAKNTFSATSWFQTLSLTCALSAAPSLRCCCCSCCASAAFTFLVNSSLSILLPFTLPKSVFDELNNLLLPCLASINKNPIKLREITAITTAAPLSRIF